MPLVELNKQVIYGNFFSALHNDVEAIGIDPGKPETLETAFQIKGLITAIDATYYFADTFLKFGEVAEVLFPRNSLPVCTFHKIIRDYLRE